jgi:hypothetical protein
MRPQHRIRLAVIVGFYKRKAYLRELLASFCVLPDALLGRAITLISFADGSEDDIFEKTDIPERLRRATRLFRISHGEDRPRRVIVGIEQCGDATHLMFVDSDDRIVPSAVLSAHGKSSRSAERLSGTGAAALASGAVAKEGSPSVRGGAASRSPSAVGEPPGPATGGRRLSRFAESGARRKQTSAACRRPAEDRAPAEAWAGSSGVRNRFVDRVAGGAPDRERMWGSLPCLAGLTHSAAVGMELSASHWAGAGAG